MLQLSDRALARLDYMDASNDLIRNFDISALTSNQHHGYGGSQREVALV